MKTLMLFESVSNVFSKGQKRKNHHAIDRKGSPRNTSFAKLGILSQQGGGGLTESQLFVKLENKISLCVQHNLRGACNTILEVLQYYFRSVCNTILRVRKTQF